jgi:3-carboxy-cis,cis-muconate cycloisomerase
MSVSMFDGFLSTPEMIAVFDDSAIVQAMFRFEEALARAQAAHELIPNSAARAISAVCAASLYDIAALVHAGRRAGSLAIPLVQELTKTVALYDKEAANYVHFGSTSQDVIDTAMAIVTRDALALLDRGIGQLTATLLALAEQHADTPVLARTLMQPAQVSSFGFKAAGWAAPLVRARARLHSAADSAIQVQLGGAVGTLSAMPVRGAEVRQQVAADLGLACPPGSWHTERDDWVRLGLEVAVLTGSLGKIATDLALMAQGEIGELAEPSDKGRGGSSAMPHKRNPVSAMIALAASHRTPHSAAALLGTMCQQHERGLGNWQAELAAWPSLFLSAHGALAALNEAFAALQVNPQRMQANIAAQNGMVYGEALSGHLAVLVGRPAAHELVDEWSRAAVVAGRTLYEVAADAAVNDARLRGKVDLARLLSLFDPVAAAAPAAALARDRIAQLRAISAKEKTA